MRNGDDYSHTYTHTHWQGRHRPRPTSDPARSQLDWPRERLPKNRRHYHFTLQRSPSGEIEGGQSHDDDEDEGFFQHFCRAGKRRGGAERQTNSPGQCLRRGERVSVEVITFSSSPRARSREREEERARGLNAYEFSRREEEEESGSHDGFNLVGR